MLTNKKLKEIFLKNNGHCHFCGDPLIFKKYGCKNINNLEGAWEADHIIQKGKGGSKSAENCLPACVRCNRLRWHRTGTAMRELLLLGITGKAEIKKNNQVGKQLKLLAAKRLAGNRKRRRQ